MDEAEFCPKHRHQLSLWIFCGIVLAVAATACLAALNGLIVCWRAEVIAGDRPYCIQAAGPGWSDFHPVRRLAEMSFWEMQGRTIPGASSSLGAAQNHAVLVLGSKPEFLNWSYKNENFRDKVLNQFEFQSGDPRKAWYAPAIVCKPVKHFASTISWF